MDLYLCETFFLSINDINSNCLKVLRKTTQIDFAQISHSFPPLSEPQQGKTFAAPPQSGKTIFLSAVVEPAKTQIFRPITHPPSLQAHRQGQNAWGFFFCSQRFAFKLA